MEQKKQLMFAFGKNREYIRITIFSTILSLTTMFFLLHFMGLKGAFISTIIAEIFIIVSYNLVLKSSFVNGTNQ